MMEDETADKEHRCFCSKSPMLGKYNNEYYEVRYRDLFIRIYPNYTKIRCKLCHRWHTINVVKGEIDIEQIKETIDKN
jgi:hypothetical protein